MSEFTFDLDAVQRLTAGAVGPKGQRVSKHKREQRGNRPAIPALAAPRAFLQCKVWTSPFAPS